MRAVENIVSRCWIVSRFTVLVLACMLLAACEDDSKSRPLGSGHDFGNNNRDVVLAIGDSITEGKYNDTPYPEHLATMINKQVINAGVSGTLSIDGVDRIESRLIYRQPGFVVILYGSNDASRGREVQQVIGNLRAMVQACQRNKSIPIICTLTPQTGSRIVYQNRVDEVNAGIRAMAKAENVVLADVAREFVGKEYLLISDDNLHPNETGAFVIAETVAKVF